LCAAKFDGEFEDPNFSDAALIVGQEVGGGKDSSSCKRAARASLQPHPFMEIMMSKKSFLHTLVCLSLLLFAAGTHAASATSQKKEPSAEEVKKRVVSYGLGVMARVKVKLRNGAKMEGFIDSAGDDHFYLIRTDEQNGTAAVVAYSNVARIEGKEEKKSFLNWRQVTYRVGTGAGVLLSILRNLQLPGSDLGPRFSR
jgi:hypothetical protein